MPGNPFDTAILKMHELGVFQFVMPFMLSSAIFYGLIRKSQIFGPPEKNVAVNAVVALVASFMVWAAPIIAGIDITTQLVSFFTQGMTATLVILVGLMIASMFFPPNLSEQLSKAFGEKGRVWGIIIVAALLVGGGVLFSSGLISVFFPEGVRIALSSDIFITVAILLLLVITVLVIIVPGGK